MRISCDDLVLEVTRRCNMDCAHCLRGDARNADMTEDMVKQAIAKLDHIGEVVFTGGEPTLNLPLIRFFFEEAERQNKLPSSFYVVTNGKANMKELALLLLEWYPRMDEKELCGVTISHDRFHDIDWDDDDAPLNYLEGLAFYRPDDKNNSNKRDNWVIPLGRAEKNGLGSDVPYFSTRIDLSVDVWDDNANIDLLYVSVNGNVSGNCDLPFETLDKSPYTLGELEKAVKQSVYNQAEIA